MLFIPGIDVVKHRDMQKISGRHSELALTSSCTSGKYSSYNLVWFLCWVLQVIKTGFFLHHVCLFEGEAAQEN